LNIPYISGNEDGLEDTELKELVYKRSVTGFLLQAVNILYLLTSQPFKVINVPNFIKQWTMSLPEDPVYDITNIIDPIIPALKTSQDFFTWWVSICPSMIQNKKIIIPRSKIFKERLEEHLVRFTRIYSGDQLVMPQILIGTNFNETDENDHEIQMNATTLPVYLMSQKATDPEIVTKLTDKMKNKSLIYYKQSEKDLFLIQNSEKLDEAVKILSTWKKDHRNAADTFDENEPLTDYTLVKISPNGTLPPVASGSRIIQYSGTDPMFGAVLAL